MQCTFWFSLLSNTSCSIERARELYCVLLVSHMKPSCLHWQSQAPSICLNCVQMQFAQPLFQVFCWHIFPGHFVSLILPFYGMAAFLWLLLLKIDSGTISFCVLFGDPGHLFTACLGWQTWRNESNQNPSCALAATKLHYYSCQDLAFLAINELGWEAVWFFLFLFFYMFNSEDGHTSFW